MQHRRWQYSFLQTEKTRQQAHIRPPCNIMIFAIKNHRAITVKYNVPYFHISSSSYLYICTSEWIYRIHSEIRLKFPGWVFPLSFLYLRPRRGFSPSRFHAQFSLIHIPISFQRGFFCLLFILYTRVVGFSIIILHSTPICYHAE